MPQAVRARALVPVLVYVGTVVAVVSSLGAPLVPTVAEQHGVSLAAGQWSLTVSLLVGAVATPALGRLGDGPRRTQVVVAVLVAVAAGCLLAALPLGFAALLAGRALQGLGLGITPLAMAVARDALPLERARSAVAMLSVTTVAGVGVGYPLTGLLTEAFGLPGGFWFGAGMSGTAALLAAWVLPAGGRRRAAHASFDVLGAVLLGGGLAALLVAVSESGQWGVSRRLGALLVVSVALLAGWARHELRTPAPLVDLRLLRSGPVRTAAVTAVLAGTGMYLLLSIVTRLVQTPVDAGYGFGASVVVAGLVLVPFSLTSVAASRVAPVVARRTTPTAVLPLGSAMFLLAALAFAVAHDSLWQVLALMGVAGLGVGCTFAALPGLVLPAVPASQTGSAMGFNQVLRMVGFSIGSALSAAVLELHTPAGEALPTESGYLAAGLVCAGVWVLAAVLSAVLPGRPGRAAAPAPAPAVARR